MCFLAIASFAMAGTVVVSPSNMGNWVTIDSDASVATSFVAGPPVPPFGTGSAQMTVGADGDQFTMLRDPVDYLGTALSDLKTLTYSTYQQNYIDGQAIVLSLQLSNGDKIYFEPVYQTGGYGGDPVPDQCSGITNCAGLNQWQTWDALAGGWWAASNYGGSNGGPPNFTIADYAAGNPGVTIAAIRLFAGGGAGAWDNFKGNVDGLIIGTSSVTTTFDFEPASVPEPATFGLAGLALAGIGVLRKRRK